MNDRAVDVSVIILTFNSRPVIESCLDSLQSAAKSLALEVIVVDNSSSDGSIEVVSGHPLRPTVIASEHNLGFAGGCNLGARKACGEFLLFLNPDVEVDADSIVKLFQFSRPNQNFGLVTARLRNSDGSFQPNCRRFPTVRNLFGSRGSMASRFFRESGSYTLPDFDGPTEVEAVAATMALVSRRTFESLNGFDQRFFLYMEDTDLCLRAHQADFHNYFLPSAGGKHLWAKGSDAGSIRRQYHHHRSVWKYFRKHFPRVTTMIMLAFMLPLNFLLVSLFGGKRAGK